MVRAHSRERLIFDGPLHRVTWEQRLGVGGDWNVKAEQEFVHCQREQEMLKPAVTKEPDTVKGREGVYRLTWPEMPVRGVEARAKS